MLMQGTEALHTRRFARRSWRAGQLRPARRSVAAVLFGRPHAEVSPAAAGEHARIEKVYDHVAQALYGVSLHIDRIYTETDPQRLALIADNAFEGLNEAIRHLALGAGDPATDGARMAILHGAHV